MDSSDKTFLGIIDLVCVLLSVPAFSGWSETTGGKAALPCSQKLTSVDRLFKYPLFFQKILILHYFISNLPVINNLQKITLKRRTKCRLRSGS